MINNKEHPKADILIIDDNVDNLHILYEILNQEGYKVRPAITGKLGLTALKHMLPDLILLDLVLPDMSGYDVLKELKTDKRTTELPVIVISFLNTIEDKIRAFNAGCIDYINKPFQPDEVLARINTQVERVKNRKKLQESENRFYELFNNISSGVAIYKAREDGADFEFIDFNKAGMKIDHIRKEAVTGQPVTAVFPGIKEFGLLDVFRRVWKSGIPEKHPIALYMDSRITGWRDNYVYKLSSGEIVAVYEDITEKKQAEAEILEYSELARSLLMVSTDAILIFDPHGVMLDANKVFLDSFRLTREQILGKNSWNAMPQEFADKWKRLVAGVIEEKQAHRLVHMWNQLWYDTTLYPVFDSHNNVGKLIVFFHDITENIEHEEQINKALAEKEVLLKEIHHRVKNNLQIIASMLNLQARCLADKQVSSLFEDSKNRIFAISLVHQLLYQSSDISNIDIKRYAKELTGYLYRSLELEKEKIKITMDIEDLMLTMNQAMPCGLIFNELISNSLKYAFPGNARGEIRLCFRKTAADSCLLSVSDDGCGIPALVDTAEPVTLGLKLVHTLTEQLGGTLVFSGDTGTRIDIVFPLVG